MRKIGVLVLCIILLLLTISCSNNSNDITTEAGSKDEKQEITILITGYDFLDMEYDCCAIRGYTERFEIETGVRVNFDVINGNKSDDYDKKMNAKLYLEEGPTLIYISGDSSYKNYIEQGIAVNTEGKIPNLIRIYDSLLDDGHYFVPVGMSHYPVQLNRCAFDKLEIDDPKLDWTREEYLKIKEKWLKIEPEYFSQYEYDELFTFMIDDLEILDESNKGVSLNNSRVIQYINDVREEIFSGKYIINKDYTFKNYYNMIFEGGSKESKESKNLFRRYNNENLRKKCWTNGLKSLEISKYINAKDDIFLPNTIYEKNDLLRTYGFIVNKNGKNIDLGMEFLNGLLSDEIQLEMFKSKWGDLYPVNKEIENEIERIEKEINDKIVKEKKEGVKHYVRKDINKKAIALRKYILSQVKTGNYKHCSNSKIINEVKKMIHKDFAKFIFADEPYTEEELGRELQKLENKYNMWLNE
ncbi:extracellular solute-binding protein [Abyssisolibacter fermentans]|uniref:extracellular solute-binding protein n=1 Tax=Abyssisolibacter fermentans TaxID=1766203 RepID=UPI0008357403|nr:extracellular solute-binding protein [Abyssisolibacter fermentans]